MAEKFPIPSKEQPARKPRGKGTDPNTLSPSNPSAGDARRLDLAFGAFLGKNCKVCQGENPDCPACAPFRKAPGK